MRVCTDSTGYLQTRGTVGGSEAAPSRMTCDIRSVLADAGSAQQHHAAKNLGHVRTEPRECAMSHNLGIPVGDNPAAGHVTSSTHTSETRRLAACKQERSHFRAHWLNMFSQCASHSAGKHPTGVVLLA